MQIIHKNLSYIFDGWFPEKIFSGFTSTFFQGKPEEDISSLFLSFGFTKKIAYMKQIHSERICFVKDAGEYEGDGLFTNSKDLSLVVKTADCMPIILHSEVLKITGVIHMGWRSAICGILDNIIRCVNISELSSFKIILGPGMRKCCYSVGEEFFGHKSFVPFLSRNGERIFFDPVNFSRNTLLKYGVDENSFCDTDICSICSGKDIFSHRKKHAGRTLSFITVKK
ncbi:Multi-copper polyphenol oxidoreductase, laccase [Candidatus Omnitrophus magneticus]|uniref:Multi-copper polyphenol oxidoreductase, laccase n=1 Tax=Candidatus Omnitrophus magneticus TaxID=1609969 RepID=A0A0F0CN66_9BACT|nr:Multi-copper polyphenol oxidoreductase, laccase [Candidatus Omnitrophus magneticus]